MSSRDYWSTPKWLYKLVHEHWNPTLDVCATEENAKCRDFIDESSDALNIADWARYSLDSDKMGTVTHKYGWMNPPYSDPFSWLEAASKQDMTIIALVRLDPSTRWWRDIIMKKASLVILLSPRIQFEAPPGIKSSSNNGSNALVVFPPKNAPHMGEPTIRFWDIKPYMPK